jgi:hypothetical protein
VMKVGDDDIDGQGFIVNDEAADIGHESGIFSVIWNSPAVWDLWR